MKIDEDEVKKVLRDLNKKCHDDVCLAMRTSLDLIGDMMGNAGIYAMTQKMASTFVEGAAMGLASMRGKDKPTPDDFNDDDVLFVGIVAILTAQKAHRPELLRDALDKFETVQGYPYKLPSPWHTEH